MAGYDQAVVALGKVKELFATDKTVVSIGIGHDGSGYVVRVAILNEAGRNPPLPVVVDGVPVLYQDGFKSLVLYEGESPPKDKDGKLKES